MNTRSRRNGYGTLGGYTAAPSSYGFYPSYFSTPYYSGYSSGYTSGYSSYYSRSSAYTPSTSNYGNEATVSRPRTTETPRDARIREPLATRTRYRGAKTDSDLVLGLRSKSQEPSLAKEASVTRELYRE